MATAASLDRFITTVHTYSFQTTSEVPVYCKKLATLLDQQPLFRGEGAIAKKAKVVAMECFSDARIFEIFNRNAEKVLGTERAWSIHNIQWFGFSGASKIRDGLALWFGSGIPCSVDELEEAYNQVLESLTNGWIQAKAEENPDILHTENPEDFHLFIKKSTLTEEDTLIRFLTEKFSLRTDITCDSALKAFARSDNIYMWVRKTRFEDVVNKFGFKLSNL